VNSRTDEISKAPLFGYDANSMTLYLKSIPKTVSRWELLNLIREETRGFVSLSISEPLRTHDFERYAWVSYDSEENCRLAKEILEHKTLHDGNVRL
jgi:L-ribulose-5-phosphate 3-epimerase UlaE